MTFRMGLLYVMLGVLFFVTSWTLCSGKCFSDITGEIVDILKPAEEVRAVNSLNVLPRLRNLLSKDYFHFYEVNLKQGCPFFPDDDRCSVRHCKVENCSVEEVPKGIVNGHKNHKPKNHKASKYSKETNSPASPDDINCDLGRLDDSIGSEGESTVADWRQHDASDELNFCEFDDETSDDTIYVNLLNNPERFTGYQGKESHNIWDMIYNENCFGASRRAFTYGQKVDKDWMKCTEKRSFYRMISGLHSSISIHLCSNYPLHLGIPLMAEKWGLNVEMFRKRFDPNVNAWADAQLRNLAFAYAVELRALSKAAPFLARSQFFTGEPETDAETGTAVLDLLDYVMREGNFFDERVMFKDDSEETLLLKEDFRLRFHNISRIMDCVGCEKCRMWGKLQTRGMGTALKILLSNPKPDYLTPAGFTVVKEDFYLTRTEIVSLFNALGRLANSLNTLTEACESIAGK